MCAQPISVPARWQLVLAKARIDLAVWPTDVREVADEQTGNVNVHIYFPPTTPVSLGDGRINPDIEQTVQLVWTSYGFQFPPFIDYSTNAIGTGKAPKLF